MRGGLRLRSGGLAWFGVDFVWVMADLLGAGRNLFGWWRTCLLRGELCLDGGGLAYCGADFVWVVADLLGAGRTLFG